MPEPLYILRFRYVKPAKTLIKVEQKLAGIFACPEGAATLAALKRLVESGEVSKDERVLLYNTGSGIKYTDVYVENIKLDLPVVNSIEDVEKLMV